MCLPQRRRSWGNPAWWSWELELPSCHAAMAPRGAAAATRGGGGRACSCSCRNEQGPPYLISCLSQSPVTPRLLFLLSSTCLSLKYLPLALLQCGAVRLYLCSAGVVYGYGRVFFFFFFWDTAEFSLTTATAELEVILEPKTRILCLGYPALTFVLIRMRRYQDLIRTSRINFD